MTTPANWVTDVRREPLADVSRFEDKWDRLSAASAVETRNEDAILLAQLGLAT